jgi:hypothetical protein
VRLFNTIVHTDLNKIYEKYPHLEQIKARLIRLRQGRLGSEGELAMVGAGL